MPASSISVRPMMRLELARHPVREIRFSDTTRLSDGVLHVSRDEIREIVTSSGPFQDVELDIAKPGDKTRIINVLDAVEPRYKASGSGTVFPGMIGAPVTTGEGLDHVLEGMAVLTVGEPAPGESVHWRDSVVDMWGAGAQYTPFSKTLNLVVRIKGKSEFDSEEVQKQEWLDAIDGSDYSRAYNFAARRAGFKVADFLASAARDSVPDTKEVLELPPVADDLPRVFYVCQLHRDRWLYAERMGWQPTFVHPNEIFDGAVFSSFMGPAGSRDCSYFYQNNPVIRQLYRRHGADLNFAGVLLWFYGPMNVDEKDLIGGYATKLLRMVKADGAILTWIGDGQSGVDVMMMCQKFERAGIHTTVLSPEMALTVDDPGFVHYVEEADALVSTGNYEMNLDMQPPDRVLGGTHLAVRPIDAAGPLSLPLRFIYGAVNPAGFNRLAGVGY